jgi:hypothetical protein
MGQLFILGGKTAILNGTDNTWIVDVADFRSVLGNKRKEETDKQKVTLLIGLVYDTILSASISMATINDIPPGLIR